MHAAKAALRLLIGLVALAALAPASFGFESDGCEKQRAQYPKRWTDVSREKTLFNCAASDGNRLNVRLGERQQGPYLDHPDGDAPRCGRG